MARGGYEPGSPAFKAGILAVDDATICKCRRQNKGVSAYASR